MEISAFIAYKIRYFTGHLSYLQWKKLKKDSATVYLWFQNILLFFTAHFTWLPVTPESASPCFLQMLCWEMMRISPDDGYHRNKSYYYVYQYRKKGINLRSIWTKHSLKISHFESAFSAQAVYKLILLSVV